MKNIKSPFDIELINGLSDWAKFGAILLVIFTLSMGYEYYKYQTLLNGGKLASQSQDTESKNAKSTKDSSEDSTQARVSLDGKVLLQYKKPEKNYYVLKLKSSDGAIFYTTSREDLKDLRGRFVNVYGKLGDDCTFSQYLKSCFVIGFTISLLPQLDYRSGILEWIDTQHSEIYESGEFDTNLLGSLYKNIFLATPMEPQLREVSATLGIAHILAISGFHLGIITLVLYGLFAPPYRYFQRRYFTYRNEFYDINFILLVFAFLYLFILDWTPSFLRSFVMFAFGVFVLWRGLNLLSFKLLLACVLFILALFPRIFNSIGFWLSVSGVFYIYLYLKNAPKWGFLESRFHFLRLKTAAYILSLNFVVFFNMLVISHYFFYTFSPYQLLSPLLTLGFIIFYPLVFVLHLFGFGGILDSALYAVISYDFERVDLSTPLWFLIGFILLSFLAIFQKFVYYFTIILSVSFCLYGIFLFYQM